MVCIQHFKFRALNERNQRRTRRGASPSCTAACMETRNNARQVGSIARSLLISARQTSQTPHPSEPQFLPTSTNSGSGTWHAQASTTRCVFGSEFSAKVGQIEEQQRARRILESQKTGHPDPTLMSIMRRTGDLPVSSMRIFLRRCVAVSTLAGPLLRRGG